MLYLRETEKRVGTTIIRYNTFGGSPLAEHEMPCPVCMSAPAVLQFDTTDGVVFQPCWACLTKGFRTVRITGLRRRILRALGLIVRR
jgi:hypothetical protein